MKIVKVETDKIKDWESFHLEFKNKMWFPNFYWKNMDAWVDCMTYLDDPDSWMTDIIINEWDILVLEIENAEYFKNNYREFYDSIIECMAFVNYRRIKKWFNPVLTISFN